MPRVRVEVCLYHTFKLSPEKEQLLRENIVTYITARSDLIPPGQIFRPIDDVDNRPAIFQVLEAVSSLIVCDPIQDANDFYVYFYTLTETEAEIEYIESERNSNEEIEAGTHWILPCTEFEGLYEGLMFEPGVKESLLSLVETTVHFSQHKINSNIIANNRLVLTWGPPGTGKTSLCKALAQKLAIRSMTNFQYTHLIEINCHSLFSKWFSESGKLVQQMFQKIHELIENPQSLVCVLIDEVESIAYSRGNVGSNEPTDSLRVVNAVLTQLDRIRRFNNVLVLTTSNVPACIDNAFIDRADVVQYIGPPTVIAIKSIYLQILKELLRCNVIRRGETEELDSEGVQLLAEKSYGLSGRSIRKIPLLAHATIETKSAIPLSTFLDAMYYAATKMLSEKKAFEVIHEEPQTEEAPAHYFNVEDIQNLQIVDNEAPAPVMYVPNVLTNGNGIYQEEVVTQESGVIDQVN